MLAATKTHNNPTIASLQQANGQQPTHSSGTHTKSLKRVTPTCSCQLVRPSVCPLEFELNNNLAFLVQRRGFRFCFFGSRLILSSGTDKFRANTHTHTQIVCNMKSSTILQLFAANSRQHTVLYVLGHCFKYHAEEEEAVCVSHPIMVCLMVVRTTK